MPCYNTNKCTPEEMVRPNDLNILFDTMFNLQIGCQSKFSKGLSPQYATNFNLDDFFRNDPQNPIFKDLPIATRPRHMNIVEFQDPNFDENSDGKYLRSLFVRVADKFVLFTFKTSNLYQQCQSLNSITQRSPFSKWTPNEIKVLIEIFVQAKNSDRDFISRQFIAMNGGLSKSLAYVVCKPIREPTEVAKLVKQIEAGIQIPQTSQLNPNVLTK